MGLEADLSVYPFTDGSNESLKRSLGEEKLSGFLIALDLSEGHCAWSPSHLPLDTAFSRCGLLLGFVNQLA